MGHALLERQILDEDLRHVPPNVDVDGARRRGRAREQDVNGGESTDDASEEASTESEESEEDVPLAEARAESGSPPPLAVSLRPRPKPKPAYKGAKAPAAVPASSGDEEDT